jgi:thioredoxin reductase (NADPH)
MLAAADVEHIERDGEDTVLSLAGGQQVCAHSVLIATGSSYRRLGVPGEDELIGAGVHFCATCDGPFYKGADELLVIGGGNSGLEEGMSLSQFAERIRIVEFAPELKASRLLQDKVRADPRFAVHTNTEVVELKGAPKLEEVVARDRATGQELRWRPKAPFVFIGLDPNTAFLRGTVDLDRWGFVVADRHQTSMAGVFCAGDVRAGSTKQLGAAVGEGITALLEVRRHLEKHRQIAAHATNA